MKLKAVLLLLFVPFAHGFSTVGDNDLLVMMDQNNNEDDLLGVFDVLLRCLPIDTPDDNLTCPGFTSINEYIIDRKKILSRDIYYEERYGLIMLNFRSRLNNFDLPRANKYMIRNGWVKIDEVKIFYRDKDNIEKKIFKYEVVYKRGNWISRVRKDYPESPPSPHAPKEVQQREVGSMPFDERGEVSSVGTVVFNKIK